MLAGCDLNQQCGVMPVTHTSLRARPGRSRHTHRESNIESWATGDQWLQGHRQHRFWQKHRYITTSIVHWVQPAITSQACPTFHFPLAKCVAAAAVCCSWCCSYNRRCCCCCSLCCVPSQLLQVAAHLHVLAPVAGLVLLATVVGHLGASR